MAFPQHGDSIAATRARAGDRLGRRRDRCDEFDDSLEHVSDPCCSERRRRQGDDDGAECVAILKSRPLARQGGRGSWFTGYAVIVASRIASHKAPRNFVFFGHDENDNNIETP